MKNKLQRVLSTCSIVCLGWIALPQLASAFETRTIEPPAALTPDQDCELVLRMYYQDVDGATEIYAVTDHPDPELAKRYKNGLCIKRPGDGIRIPADILLWIGDVMDHEQNFLGGELCRAHTVKTPTPNDKWGTCQWSHIFRNRFPFTFELIANQPLRELVSAFRVFRNGELAYSWTAGAEKVAPKQMRVEGIELRRKRLPHLSEVTLLIAPAEVSVDTKLVASGQTQTLLGLKDAAKALRSELTELGSDNNAAPTKVSCVLDALEGSPLPPACSEHGVPADVLPDVAGAFQALPGSSTEAVALAESSLKLKFQRLDAVIDSAFDQVDTTKLKAAPARQRVKLAVERYRDWALTLRGAALVLEDGNRAAQIYASVAQLAMAREQALSARVPNPPPAPDERAVQMRYGDSFQFYALAGWNGVPFRVSQGVGFVLEPTVAVPIVDALGFRLQWGASRLSEFRLGCGGLMFLEDDMTTPKDVDASDKKLLYGPQVSVSLGTLRVGLAYAANQQQASAQDKLRLLFGVDLVKLISGENFEAANLGI